MEKGFRICLPGGGQLSLGSLRVVPASHGPGHCMWRGAVPPAPGAVQGMKGSPQHATQHAGPPPGPAPLGPDKAHQAGQVEEAISTHPQPPQLCAQSTCGFSISPGSTSCTCYKEAPFTSCFPNTIPGEEVWIPGLLHVPAPSYWDMEKPLSSQAHLLARIPSL